MSLVRDSRYHPSRLDQAGNGDAGGSQTWGDLAEWRRPAERNQFGTRKATRLGQCWTSVVSSRSDWVRSTIMSPTVSTKTVKTKEAKNTSKSEAEVVDVMDTLQRTISIIKKEIAKNPTFLQKVIDPRNPNSIRTVLIIRKTSMSRVFSKQCQRWGVPPSRSSTSSFLCLALWLQRKMITTQLTRSTACIPSRRLQWYPCVVCVSAECCGGCWQMCAV